jgi:hypothetical protein
MESETEMKPRRIPAFDLNAEIHKEMDIDQEPLRFGKHAGKTPEEIADEDPSYIIWMFENVRPSPCSTSLYELVCMEEGEGSFHEVDGFLRFK